MYDKTTDYVTMWSQDKRAIIATMHRNLTSDLNAGYNPIGDCVRKQQQAITAYTANYEVELMALANKSNPNYWCYLDMVRRGAIDD